jgi:hypothetical protein
MEHDRASICAEYAYDDVGPQLCNDRAFALHPFPNRTHLAVPELQLILMVLTALFGSVVVTASTGPVARSPASDSHDILNAHTFAEQVGIGI